MLFEKKKQKTAYEMCVGDWSSDVCSSDLLLEKTVILGEIGGRRRRGPQRMRWLDGITDYGHEFEQAPGVDDGQGSLVCCSLGSQRVRHD